MLILLIHGPSIARFLQLPRPLTRTPFLTFFLRRHIMIFQVFSIAENHFLENVHYSLQTTIIPFITLNNCISWCVGDAPHAFRVAAGVTWGGGSWLRVWLVACLFYVFSSCGGLPGHSSHDCLGADLHVCLHVCWLIHILLTCIPDLSSLVHVGADWWTAHGSDWMHGRWFSICLGSYLSVYLGILLHACMVLIGSLSQLQVVLHQ